MSCFTVLAAAVRYHREHGDLNVPYNYVDNEGIKLGQWLNGLRSNRNGTARNYRELTDEQITRLDAIGMIWDTKYEKQWNDAFQALCDYKVKNATFDIPAVYQTESGIRLGAWIRRQRDFYEKGRISDEHIEPKDYAVNNFELWIWIRSQKSQYKNGKLSSERVELLDAIDMDWSNIRQKEIENSYKIGFQHLEEFINENSVTELRHNTVCGDGYKLGNWITKCKQKYRNGKLKQAYVQCFKAQ